MVSKFQLRQPFNITQARTISLHVPRILHDFHLELQRERNLKESRITRLALHTLS